MGDRHLGGVPCDDYSRLRLPLSERLPIVLYSNRFEAHAETAWITPQVERMTSYTPDEWTGNPGFLETVLHPDDRDGVVAEMAASRAELREFSRDYRLIRRDGTVLWIHDESVPIVDDSGRPELIQGYFIDISARKELEQQLLHVQRTEALGRLAGEIAHEVNNHLTAVLGHVAFLDRIPIGAEARRHVEEIRATANRSGRLTKQLLAYARREKPAGERLEVEDIVTRLKSLLESVVGKDVTLAYELGATPTVCVCRSRVEQVVVNLVTNARDAMADGGTVTISTEPVTVESGVEAERLRIQTGEYAALCVSDTGSGIPDDIRERIFEPFFTTKARDRGTGLGLSIVDKIVRQYGGAIDVETSPAGTTFRVLLPSCP